MKKKKLIITFSILFVTLLIVGIIFLKPDREDLLYKAQAQYTDMISVGLCQESYDQFVTDGSKERKGDNFFAHCDYRKEKWSNFNIESVVFSEDKKRADIKYSYDLKTADLESAQYKNCVENSFFDIQTCSRSAPEKIEKATTIETWLFQEGSWKRDY